MRNREIFQTNVIFVSTAIVVILLSVFSYKKLNTQSRASTEVERTQLLKFKLNDAFSHLLKTESAQRGYILTHDSTFLEDYFYAQKEIPALLSEIQTLISKNGEQIRNFKASRELFRTRLDNIRRTLRVYENISVEDLEKKLINGKKISFELNQKIDEMIRVEDLLLVGRISAQKKEEQYTSILILLLSIISTAVLVYSYFRVKAEALSNKNLQNKILERTKELNIANTILNEQNKELKRKNLELASFNFVANHDLKEPLRKIELFINLVNDSDDTISTENRILLEKILKCAKRMDALLEDIYYYSLTDKPKDFKLTDLNKTVETAIRNLQEAISDKNAIIQYGELPEIYAVPQHMEQLFTNIISNSLKYSRRYVNPIIRIESELFEERGSRYWQITFSDNGIGFNEVYKEKIFEMFQKLHPRNIYQGTGIGLTICKKIVENHEGTITAHASEGQGADFIVVLPENRSFTNRFKLETTNSAIES